jgi:hypothetical protein
MNLTEKTALDCGLKIREPHVDRSFIPLPFERFIIFDTRCKHVSGKYDFFSDVLSLIRPYLKNNEIKVIQLLDEKDYKLACDKSFLKINKKQEAYLISKSELIICNDNYSLYLASALNKKSIGLYSIFDPRNTAPVWNKHNQTILESDRFGNKPSYGLSNENPKTINSISPYEIATKLLSNLKIKNDLDKIDLLHLGEKYNQQIVEIVPDFLCDKDFLKGNSINLRLDLVKEINGETFYHWLANKKVNLLTKQDLNMQLLRSFKKNIIGVTVILSDSISESFLKACKSLGIKVAVYCSDKEKIKDYRFKFLDWNVEEDFCENKIGDIKNIDKNSKYVSSKIILSKGEKYASKAAYLAGVPLDKNGNNVILNESFEEELDYFKIYNETETLEKK